MKNLYETLGIRKEASIIEIKKAYRALALDMHPDKGGDAERMGLLNEAYATLSDPDKRRNFDAIWEDIQDAALDKETNIAFNEYLSAGSSIPYSHQFRKQHGDLIDQYSQSPLAPAFINGHFKSHESNLYQFVNLDGIEVRCCDLFTFIQAQTNYSLGAIPTIIHKPLTPLLAINLFTDFLAGRYFSMELREIKRYLSVEIMKIKSLTPRASEIELYEGIYEVFLMTDKSVNEHNHLMFSIKKLTNFAQKTSDVLLTKIIPLFYNKYFRHFYAYSLSIYWSKRDGLFDKENLKHFDGYQEAKELLNVLKENLSRGNESSHLSPLIRYVKLLFNFEKDLHDSITHEHHADTYREEAFHCLDWISIFITQSSRKILVNIFLQTAIKFQQASRLETHPATKMADEQLALKMYLTAVSIGHHVTPDVEIYASTLALKYISNFQFQNEILQEVIPALKNRTLILTDIFPFFEHHQSNISFLRQEHQMLHLMRKLLNAMVEIYEYNKSHSAIEIEHSATTILYQAYEACLKNWYQEEYNPEVEKKFRLDLMDELLFDNGWTSFDVEHNLNLPWVMVDRNEDGWINPTQQLPHKQEKNISGYRSINGAEINHKTGNIHFYMTSWNEFRPIYENVFTLSDLQDMLEKNIDHATFSLDPIDPQKPYHPFNLMYFSPSSLHESELLNTMLLTDYILKFLTTNQEVQGQYPFDQRPTSGMIQHLPDYLRKIVTDFHEAQNAGALHRFWIEAEEIDVTFSDQSIEEDITRIGLGSLKMIVKKHLMERDIHGELKDVGNEDEGWPIYILTQDQLYELEQGKRVIDKHAMIFKYGRNKLYYWENNTLLHTHVPQDYRETLIELHNQPKDQSEKVVQSTKNMPLIYRIIKDMARQSGISHRYSPEFIFAHEFTTHYDEFAQYLPEFGRLKELSKMSVLIRCLNGIRKDNEEKIEALSQLLNSKLSSVSLDNDAYRNYKKIKQNVSANIISLFQTWRRELSTSALQRKWREQLHDIKKDMEPLTFSNYSTEVKEVCQRIYDQVARDNPGVSSARIWSEVIEPKRSELAKELSDSKKQQYRNLLTKAFSEILLSSLGSSAYGRLIDSFMQGNINPLLDALVDKNKIEAQKQITCQFPQSSTRDITLALDDNGDAAALRIANDEVNRELQEQKEQKDKVEAGFVQIHLEKRNEDINLKGECFWVPASVRHDVYKDETSGLSRYSFFVYGGVKVQPRINVVAGGNTPLGGSRVGGGSFNRNEITKGFQSHHIASDKNRLTRNHELWKLAGMDVNSRTNKIYLPKTAEQHTTRSVHSGRHANAYSANVAKKMQKLADQGKDAGWTQSQYRQETRNLFSEIRQDLRAGNIALNKNHRTWAKK